MPLVRIRSPSATPNGWLPRGAAGFAADAAFFTAAALLAGAAFFAGDAAFRATSSSFPQDAARRLGGLPHAGRGLLARPSSLNVHRTLRGRTLAHGQPHGRADQFDVGELDAGAQISIV